MKKNRKLLALEIELDRIQKIMGVEFRRELFFNPFVIYSDDYYEQSKIQTESGKTYREVLEERFAPKHSAKSVFARKLDNAVEQISLRQSTFTK